jgi:diguanylate cyclase (GGDEF)-like protein
MNWVSRHKNNNNHKRIGAIALALVSMLFLLSLGAPALALDPAKPIGDFIHETWSVDDGLPQSTVRSIAQTRDGYIWFATHEGVARFDGRKFTVFNEANTKALRGSGIASLREARDGSLYLGLRDGGLVRHQGNKFETVAPVGGLPKGTVSVLEEDAAGAIWIGTSGGGLARLSVADNKTRIFTTAQGLPHDIVNAILPAASGEVWIGTFGGLSVIRGDELIARPTGESVDTTYISAILHDRRGGMWIATYGSGLYYQAAIENKSKNGVQSPVSNTASSGQKPTAKTDVPATSRFRLYTRADGLVSDTLTRLFEDRAGSIWVGSLEGVQRLRVSDDNRSVAAFETYNALGASSKNYVRDILEDAEGSLWLGTDRGIERFRDGRFTTWGIQRGLSEQFTRTVIEDKSGAIWVGTSDGLFRFFEQNVRRYGREDGLLNSAILSLLEARDDSIWIGTNAGGGLHRLRNGKFESWGQQLGLGAAAVRAIIEARDGALWVGANTGLYRFTPNNAGDPGVRHFQVADGLPSEQILSLFEDRKGVVWVGTREGLATIATMTNARISKHDELGANMPILSINADASGNLVVTTANGFAKMIEGKTYLFQAAQGLPARAFLSALDDRKGSLWLCSNQGIVRVANQELQDIVTAKMERIKPEYFGRSDGMATVQCNGGSGPAAWRTRDGRLMFATARGLAVVDAGKEVKPNTLPPPVHITGVLIDSEVMSLPEVNAGSTVPSLVVQPGKHRVEISYVGLSLQDPDKVSYRYRLLGFDPDWVKAGGERRAVYTNLAPGQYQFQVIASNNDGIWNEQGAMLAIDYQPQFFERALFRWLGALFLVALAITAYFARIRILRRQADSLLQLVDERTRDLAREKEKLERTNEEKAKLLVQVKEQSEAYEKLSKEDALTGLANRRELTRILSLEIERARRSLQPLCVVLADLDQFKMVNDEFSHAVGDDVLRAVGQILQEGCRTIDLVARYGGEEFAIALPTTEIAEARTMCERLRSQVEKFAWHEIHPELSVTMSFGIAVAVFETSASSAMNHDKLLDAADEELYRAKRAGRNRVSG